MNEKTKAPTRRRGAWLAALAVLLVLGVVAGPRAALAGKRAAMRAQITRWLELAFPDGFEFTRVADNLYTYRWMGYRNVVLTTKDGVILFDPLNDDAVRRVLEEVKKVAPNPEVRYVVYSHHHRDHSSGARSLPGKPIVVAHANAARDIRDHAYPDVTPPTETFDGAEYEITLGGETVKLLHLPDAHTDGQIAAYFPRQRAVFVVDLVNHRAVPPAAVTSTHYFGVRRAIDKLATLDFDILIPGHDVVGTKQDVLEYGAFLADLEGALRASLARRQLDDFHRADTIKRGTQQLADVLFDAEDALRPKYGEWQNFDTLMFPTAQWAFFGIFLGD